MPSRLLAVALLAVALAALLGATPAAAQVAVEPRIGVAQQKAANDNTQLAADLLETIARVPVKLTLPNGKPHDGEILLTHFRPMGDGPFPVVVMNHGRSAERRAEPRQRYVGFARILVRRGFAVLVLTRVGYGELGRSVDPELSGACANADYRAAVAAMAEQTAAVVRYAATLDFVDRNRIVLVGGSYGGFATIGAVARGLPGVIAGINFAGGLGGNPKQRPGDPCQGERIAGIAADAGAKAKTPMIWLYSENDKYWGAQWPRRWHEAFVKAGGEAQFVMLPPIGEDGHTIFGAAAGFMRWRPLLDEFLARFGFKPPAANSKLPASGFASLDDLTKVPHIVEAARKDGYGRFLQADVPRAFALALSGGWSWRTGPQAVEQALAGCQQRAKSTCRLYAVDDRVVWPLAAAP